MCFPRNVIRFAMFLKAVSSGAYLLGEEKPKFFRIKSPVLSGKSEGTFIEIFSLIRVAKLGKKSEIFRGPLSFLLKPVVKALMSWRLLLILFSSRPLLIFNECPVISRKFSDPSTLWCEYFLGGQLVVQRGQLVLHIN